MIEPKKSWFPWFRSQQSSQKQRLPDYGLSYFDHLYGEYRSLPTPKFDLEVDKIVKGLCEKRHDASLTWNDLYTFDLLLARQQPREKLTRKIWSLRSRYRDVAGLEEYDAYLATKP